MTMDRRVVVLSAGQVLNALGGGLIIPYLPGYLERGAGTALAVGVVFALATVASATGRIFGGELADRWGRRKVILVATALRSVFFLALALAGFLGASVPVLALCYVLASLPRGALEPASDAMVADVVPEAGRLRAYSWIRIARNAGWAAGPMAGSFAGSGGLPALALATGLLGLVNFAQCAVLLPESPHLRPIEKFRPTDLGISLSDPVFRAHALASFALFMGFAQLLVTVSLDVPKRLEIPAEQLKWIYSLNGAMVVFFQALVTRAVQRFRRSHVLAAGALSYGAGYLCIGLSHDLSGVLLGAATVTLGELLALPTCVALTAELAPEDQRGRYLGAYGVCLDVGHGAGQIAGGAGLAAAGAHPLRFWCPVAVFCALSGAAFLRVGTLLRARKAVLRAASSTSSA